MAQSPSIGITVLMLVPVLFELYWIGINDPVQDTWYLKGRSKWSMQVELQERRISYRSLLVAYRQHRMAFFLARLANFIFLLSLDLRSGGITLEDRIATANILFLMVMFGLKCFELIVTGAVESENDIPTVYYELHTMRRRYPWVHMTMLFGGVFNIIFVLWHLARYLRIM